MLSDEEREALRNFKSEYETCDHYSSDLIIELDDAEIILKLIEKQSKEIEELKKYEKYYEEMEEVNKKFIAVDKIKAKIEEYEKLKTDDENSIINKIINWFINQMQSLLEKE